MNHYSYSDLKIGQTECFTVKIEDRMLASFRNITGDVNPLHMNDDFAQGNGYAGCVVYGMLTASFLSTLAGVYLPGERSLIQSIESKFVNPVYVGDELTIRGVILALNDTVKQIEIKVEIKNQNGIKVLRGKMKVGVTGEA